MARSPGRAPRGGDGVNVLGGSLAGLAGAAVGVGSGWLAVRLENLERLEEEEDEERKEYEEEVAKAAANAEESDEPKPEALPWLPERYGWTWLERSLSPAVTAFGFALFAGREGFTLLLLEHLLWVAVFSHIIIFDLKHRLILNRITYPGVLLALGLAAATPGLSLSRALLGAVCIAGFFWLFNIVSRGGIGLGDAKLGALLGAILGVAFDSVEHVYAINAVIYAIFLGGLAAVLVLATRVRSLKDPIPYGPFLCVGATIVMYTTT